MFILGIESSCDETAAAVISLPDKTDEDDSCRLLSSFVASQDDVHARYGGVVPELASRKHIENVVPLIRAALDTAKKSIHDMDGIAVTYAPGLLGSLLVGIQLAKGLALAANKPLIGINHLEGHLNAVALEQSHIPYPHIGLVVSGGHTSLYRVEDFGHYQLLGATRDDAAGEAFDKVAKLLNLGYPGGPLIDRLSEKGNPNAIRFTIPRFDKKADHKGRSNFDFSFSGIKTAVLLHNREALSSGRVSDQYVADLVASFQETVVKFLTDRALAAAKETGARAIVLAGGVAANRHLRRRLQEKCQEAGITCFIPSMSLCTDNAAMIAYVGGRYLKMGRTSDMTLNAVANQEIGL
jgi:N6-L-threonylcarbamoyladenine synthase